MHNADSEKKRFTTVPTRLVTAALKANKTCITFYKSRIIFIVLFLKIQSFSIKRLTAHRAGHFRAVKNNRAVDYD